MNRKQFVMLVVGQVMNIALVIAMLALLVVLVQPAKVEPVVVAPPTLQDFQNGKPLLYIGTGDGHPVIALMTQGFKDACADLGLLCKVIVKPGFEDSTMLDNMDLGLSIGGSGWVTSAYSPYCPKAMQAIGQGIPVCTFHTPIKQEDLPGSLAWVATNIADYGKAAADAIADKTQCKGPIAITQNTFNDTENLAASSFTEEMKVRCPDVEVLAPEIEGGELSASIAKAASILVAHPNLAAAFGTTGASPTTWAKALEQSGRNKGEVVVIGMDYTANNLDLVKSGWVYALVGQPIYEETYRCVELIAMHLAGFSVNFDNYYPAPIITFADLDKYYGYTEKVENAVTK
jgi:ribose transport system substrate-binding protein